MPFSAVLVTGTGTFLIRSRAVLLWCGGCGLLCGCALVVGLLVPCDGWWAPLGGGLLSSACGRGVGALPPAFCGCCASRVSPVCVLSGVWGVLVFVSLGFALWCWACPFVGVCVCGGRWLGPPFFPCLAWSLSFSLVFSFLFVPFCFCLCWGVCGFSFVGFGLGLWCGFLAGGGTRGCLFSGAFVCLVRCLLARGARVGSFFLFVSVGLCWRLFIGHVIFVRVVMSEKEERGNRGPVFYLFWYSWMAWLFISVVTYLFPDAVRWIFLSFFISSSG